MKSKTINTFYPDKPFFQKLVTISRIDFDARGFCFRFFHKPPQVLINSIKGFGVISPPLLLTQADKYEILDGFRRLEAARILGIENVCCKVCEKTIDEWDLLSFVLSIFLSSGQPHILDQATILTRMSESLSRQQIIKDVLPLLEQPASEKVLDRLLPLAELDERLGEALLAGSINQEMALRLMGLQPFEREQIGALFSYFSFSQSKQFEIMENINDISKKEGKSFEDIFNELGWGKNLVKSKVENRVAEGEAFRLRLRARRYPTLTCLEKARSAKIKALQLPPSLRLTPPSFFEGGTYRLSFNFKDQEGFKERVADLKGLTEKDEWIGLFTK